jgi:hypothetical protein
MIEKVGAFILSWRYSNGMETPTELDEYAHRRHPGRARHENDILRQLPASSTIHLILSPAVA